ncbi:hypothetical protein CB1_000287013 [Camelus ferus]|nr:hypothetical protein CB1_000287013 [Camelus ferus]
MLLPWPRGPFTRGAAVSITWAGAATCARRSNVRWRPFGGGGGTSSTEASGIAGSLLRTSRRQGPACARLQKSASAALRRVLRILLCAQPPWPSFTRRCWKRPTLGHWKVLHESTLYEGPAVSKWAERFHCPEASSEDPEGVTGAPTRPGAVGVGFPPLLRLDAAVKGQLGQRPVQVLVTWLLDVHSQSQRRVSISVLPNAQHDISVLWTLPACSTRAFQAAESPGRAVCGAV